MYIMAFTVPVFMRLPNTQQIFVDIFLYLILSISDEKCRQPGRPSHSVTVIEPVLYKILACSTTFSHSY